MLDKMTDLSFTIFRSSAVSISNLIWVLYSCNTSYMWNYLRRPWKICSIPQPNDQHKTVLLEQKSQENPASQSNGNQRIIRWNSRGNIQKRPRMQGKLTRWKTLMLAKDKSRRNCRNSLSYIASPRPHQTAEFEQIWEMVKDMRFMGSQLRDL